MHIYYVLCLYAIFLPDAVQCFAPGMGPPARPLRVSSDAGFRMISVTVDSVDFEAILQDLSRHDALNEVVFGASSVTHPYQVDTAFRCGAKFISSTSFIAEIVHRTKELHLMSIPGVSTADQALAAIRSGADALKVFPVGRLSLDSLTRIIQVTSGPVRSTPVIVAGGVKIKHLAMYSCAGVSGFAVGKTLFISHTSTDEMSMCARKYIEEGHHLRWGHPDAAITKT